MADRQLKLLIIKGFKQFSRATSPLTFNLFIIMHIQCLYFPFLKGPPNRSVALPAAHSLILNYTSHDYSVHRVPR